MHVTLLSLFTFSSFSKTDSLPFIVLLKSSHHSATLNSTVNPSLKITAKQLISHDSSARGYPSRRQPTGLTSPPPTTATFKFSAGNPLVFVLGYCLVDIANPFTWTPTILVLLETLHYTDFPPKVFPASKAYLMLSPWRLPTDWPSWSGGRTYYRKQRLTLALPKFDYWYLLMLIETKFVFGIK